MAPAIMGVPERPELGEELTASFCRTDPEIAIIRNQIGHDGLAARFGGEEFCVVLPGMDANTARERAEQVWAAIEGASWALATVTASIGLTTAMDDDEGFPNVMLTRADRALYVAKRNGRNCVRQFDGWS